MALSLNYSLGSSCPKHCHKIELTGWHAPGQEHTVTGVTQNLEKKKIGISRPGQGGGVRLSTRDPALLFRWDRSRQWRRRDGAGCQNYPLSVSGLRSNSLPNKPLAPARSESCMQTSVQVMPVQVGVPIPCHKRQPGLLFTSWCVCFISGVRCL